MESCAVPGHLAQEEPVVRPALKQHTLCLPACVLPVWSGLFLCPEKAEDLFVLPVSCSLLKTPAALASLLWLVSLSMGKAQPAPPLVLQNQQATQLMVPLEDTLKGQAMTVTLVGWTAEGQRTAGLPPGFKVSHPRKLNLGQKPLLPLSIQVAEESDLTRLTLHFELAGPGGTVTLDLPLQLPPRARVDLEVPEQVTTLPGYTVQLPLRIRNTGSIPARIHLEFSLALQGIPDFDLPVGAERTVNLPIPPQATDQKLEIGVVTPTSTRRKTVLLRGTRGLDTPYRVKVQLGSSVEAGQWPSEQVQLEANLSETVHFSASAQLNGLALQTPSAVLGIGKTLLSYGPSPVSGVAGSVGEGLYLSGEPVQDVQVGVGWGTRTPSLRLGAKYSGRHERLYWSVSGHTDLALTTPELGFNLQEPLGSWTLRVTPGQQTLGAMSGNYSLQGFSASTRVSYGADGWSGFLRAGFKPAGSPDQFSSQLNVLSGRWQDLAFTYSNRDTDLTWTYRPDHTHDLQGSLKVPMQDLTLKFNGAVQMQQFSFKGAEVAADLTYVQGPWQLNLNGGLRTAGSGTLNLSGKHTRLLPSGELQLEAGIRNTWASSSWDVQPFAGVTYRDAAGWEGTVAASRNGQGMQYRARLAYRFELPVPGALTAWLDGEPEVDPSARTVRLDIQGSGFQPALQGVTISGCGMTAQTDPNGKAVLKGFQGPCSLTIDRSTLPARTHLPQNILSSQPGDQLTVQLIPTFTLKGQVEYEKTPDLLAVPPAPRKVKLTFKGVDTFWKEVDLPDGTFEMPDLPIGQYTITADDGKPIQALLAPGGPPLVVTVRPPRIQTLKKTTPPLRLNWKNLAVAAGGTAQLNVTSEGLIRQVVVRSGDWTHTQNCQDQKSCEATFGVPAAPDGLLALQIEVLFQDGGSARRSAQLIVTP